LGLPKPPFRVGNFNPTKTTQGFFGVTPRKKILSPCEKEHISLAGGVLWSPQV